MSHSRITVRGIFLNKVDGTFTANDGHTRLSIKARERLWGKPICEVEIGGVKVNGKVADLESLLKGKLPPKLAAAIQLDGFLADVAREVGHYQTFSLHNPLADIKVSPAVPVGLAHHDSASRVVFERNGPTDATVAATAAPIHYMSARQVLDEIRSNHSAYAVLSVAPGTVVDIFGNGNQKISGGGYNIVKCILNPKFPFHEGVVAKGEQFRDLEPFGVGAPDSGTLIVLRIKQQGVIQTKIWVSAGVYTESGTQSARTAVGGFIINSDEKTFASIHKITDVSSGNYENPNEVRALALGLLAFVKSLFPDVYARANCGIAESGKLQFFVVDSIKS